MESPTPSQSSLAENVASLIAMTFPGHWRDVSSLLLASSPESIPQRGFCNRSRSMVVDSSHDGYSSSYSEITRSIIPIQRTPPSELSSFVEDSPNQPFPAFEFQDSLDNFLSSRNRQGEHLGTNAEYPYWRNAQRPSISFSSVRSIPKVFRTGSCAIDEILNTIDLQSLVSAYKSHSLPNIPLLHLPTLKLFSTEPNSPNWDELVSDHPGIPIDVFDHSSRRPMARCLLYSVLALGAAYSLSPILARRFFDETGSEIRHVLRQMALHSGKNSRPNINIIQAFIHYIQFCLCAGDQVLEEIAVSHICCLASLVRDSQLFKADAVRRAPVSFNSSGNPKELEWCAWALSEERKRTYFCAYYVCSAGLTLVNPSEPFLGHSHVELELPCREELWEADSAERWMDELGHGCERALFQDKFAEFFEDVSVCHAHGVDGGINSTAARYPAALAMISAQAGSSPYTVYSTDSQQQVAKNRPHASFGISELGCLVLILALNESTWAWRKGQQSGSDSQNVTSRSTDDFQSALNKWENIWKSYPKAKSTLAVRDKLLISCLPIFDHTKLALQVDISSAKDALHSRNYEEASAVFKNIFIHRTTAQHASTTASESPSIASSVQLCSQKPYLECRKAASHAAYALKVSFEVSPWWSVSTAAVDVPIVAAIMVFHCTQIVCSWLSYIAAARATLEQHVAGLGVKAGLSPKVRLRQFLDKEDMQLIGIILDLVARQEECLEKEGTRDDEDDVLNLANNLYHLQAETIERDIAWPLLNHLAKGLRISASLLLKESRR